ncbi:hypothetical protein ACH5RR_006817 [Cinchona calisaya]|uniref:Uncharacterized protein n=1 Tax=Cinchona calisaya TaxID=153742 RepID=A0ABD3AQ25_9GENT
MLQMSLIFLRIYSSPLVQPSLALCFISQHSQIGSEFKLSDPTYAHPVPSRVIPSVFLDKDGGYTLFLNHGTRFKETKGFIINTFAELEPHAIEYLKSATEFPPIYTVGPVLNFKIGKQLKSEIITKWLDNQPTLSVVFLYFGSLAGFEPSQLKEIVTALERSEIRFLWSVHPPPPKDLNLKSVEYTNFSNALLEGFLE